MILDQSSFKDSIRYKIYHRNSQKDKIPKEDTTELHITRDRSVHYLQYVIAYRFVSEDHILVFHYDAIKVLDYN